MNTRRALRATAVLALFVVACGPPTRGRGESRQTDDGGTVTDGGEASDGGIVGDGGEVEDGGTVTDGGEVEDGGTVTDGGEVEECEGGTHLCGDVCASDSSPLTCGTSCAPCEAGSNATATCVDGVCGIKCAVGWHACGTQCLPDTSPSSCGGSCTPCPKPTNGVATCDGVSCGMSCNPGHHQCGTQCVSDTSPATCGASCSACPTPPNGSATCDGAMCGVECDAGYTWCGGNCVEEDATRCGDACSTCAQTIPENANRVCEAGECAFECAAPYLRSGNACHLPIGVAAARDFSCALLTGGRVKCWNSGPTNLTSGVTALSGGDGHGCAIVGSGVLRCWGANGSGQLGDGTTTSSPTTAVNVTGLSSGVTHVSAGRAHTCAVHNGVVKCWGAGTYGRLGNGGQTGSKTPVSVAIPAVVTQVAAGESHTCALDEDGKVYCWGYAHHGQVGLKRKDARDCGTGLTDPYCRTTPSLVAGLANVVAIEAGDIHSCALLSNGELKCWGANGRYQVSSSDCTQDYNDYCDSPKATASGVTMVTAGTQLTCYVTTAGGVRCAGYNDYGQVGLGFAGQRAAGNVFTSGAAQVSSGPTGYHVCALMDGGQVKCWGYNSDRQLGDGTRTNRSSPVDVLGR